MGLVLALTLMLPGLSLVAGQGQHVDQPEQLLPRRKPAPPVAPPPVQPPPPVIVPVPVAPVADPARGWIEATIAAAGAVLATGCAGLFQWLVRRRR